LILAQRGEIETSNLNQERSRDVEQFWLLLKFDILLFTRFLSGQNVSNEDYIFAFLKFAKNSVVFSFNQ